MADHGHAAPAASGDMGEHHATYAGFMKGAIVLGILCFFILVALVDFRFAHTLNVFTGFVGLILGTIAVLIDARAGNRWYLSGGLLVLFGLITAINIS